MIQAHPLFDKHITILRQAVAAAETRLSWNPYPETPAGRGEVALVAGREAFDTYREASFYLDQPGVIGRVGNEQSPYGLPLDINYPQCNADTLITAAKNGMSGWGEAGPEVRIGICLEILDRLHAQGVEMAHAVMHTTGQPFAFAYQHSVSGALVRGLEAVASAYREMKQVPDKTVWDRPQGKLGKQGTLKVERTFTIAPRGIALNICSPSEPTALGWPSLFASLATGNPVIINAHPSSILPMAITAAVARQVIKEAGFDANLVSLLLDDVTSSSASIVGLRSEIRIIDCAGASETSAWLEENAHQAAIFSFKSGANCVVIDSVADYKGMLRNLTFSLCLNAGQLAASPRLLLVSREGIRTPDGVVSARQFGLDLAAAIGKLLENHERAVDILGAIQSSSVVRSLDEWREATEGEVDDALLRDTSRLDHPQWPTAVVATPLLLRQELGEENRFLDGLIGPIAFVVEAATTAEAMANAERVMRDKGALNFSVYTDSLPIEQMAQGIAFRVGVALNINLTANLLASRSDAFADFYATGENPSSTCSLVDAAFVARRFFVVQTRRQI